jgi:hypothetical protein
MEVVFQPVKTGFVRGELVVVTNDHFRGEAVVGIKGSGVKADAADRNQSTEINSNKGPVPRLKAEPDPCVFGDVQKGDNLTRTIRITNEGNEDLHLDRVNVEPGGKGPFVIGEDNCTGAVLAADPGRSDHLSSCEVEIVFEPEAIREVKARLIFVSNDPAFPAYPVVLSGSGIKPHESKYPGFWGWIAILILVLRLALGLPATADGWRGWIKKNSGK